jgi:SAM-dependent methyltransferase
MAARIADDRVRVQAVSTQLAARTDFDRDQIRSRPCPNCLLCGRAGTPLYDGLSDRLYDAPGIWNLKRCANHECGLVWLDPMPLEADIVNAYTRYFTHAAPADAPPAPSGPKPLRRRAVETIRSAYRAWRYNYGPDAGKPLRWLLAMPLYLTRFECDAIDIPLRYLAVPHKGRMLDVGCGDGAVVKLAQDCGWQAEGVDFDPDAVANARSQGLAVRLGKLTEQKFPNDLFDLVLMNHVIEHVYDPLGTLREIRRVLRPGGLLVVTTPNLGSQGFRHFGRNWVHLDPPRHLYLFDPHALRSLAAEAEFRVRSASSTLRVTPFSYLASRSIAHTGKIGLLGRPGWLQGFYWRAAALLQVFARIVYRFAADELCLEAAK